MPKYIPVYDDLYETKPCFICGRDVITEGEETCSDRCRQQKEIFDDDYSWWMNKDYEGEEDEWPHDEPADGPYKGVDY